MKILIADDDIQLRDALDMILRSEGYETVFAKDGIEAVEQFRKENPDLTILDIMMPRLDGIDTCSCLRAIDPNVPILILSAKSDIIDKKSSFKSGADDYLTKPFNDEELVLRVEALLRRNNRQIGHKDMYPEAIVVGNLVIDTLRCKVSIKGKTVSLTPKELQILALLARHPGRVFTAESIIQSVWGPEYLDGSVSIPTYVRHIRAKIEDDPSEPQYVQTVWRFGYRIGE